MHKAWLTVIGQEFCPCPQICQKVPLIIGAFSVLITVFDLIGARGAYVNLFSTMSAKKSSIGR